MGSSDDERRRGSPGGRLGFEEPRSELERRRVGPGAQVDDGAHIRITRPPAAKATVDLGLDTPPDSKGVDDFSPVDEDEQGEHVSPEHCSKLSPKSSGQKTNNGKLPLNQRKSQGHGKKSKPSVNKMRAHATDPEESDYESSLPSRFSKRRNQRLQNSSSVHSRKKVQDVVVLDDEDVEPNEEVNREMSDMLNEQKIYYPSRDDREAVVLRRSDIKCLDPEAFLSSEVLNFYLKYIQRTRLCNENFRDKFYIFNTFFYGKLEKAMYQPSDFPKLRRWWKEVNLFNNAYIILPIHAKQHWSLIIICLPPKERDSEPIILHLDSLGMHHSANILDIVGRFLEKEWRFLSVAEPDWPCLLSDIRKETVQVPQQNNAYDCGIFVLYYIEQFIKEAPARFTADKLDMFSCNWFKPEEASCLRQTIRELLLEEFEIATRMDDAISKADASEGYDKIKVGVGLGNIVENNEGINVAESKEAIKVSRDAANSVKGISVVKSNEASGAFRDTGKANKGIKVTESGYCIKSMGDITDVAVLNKGPTSSNKCNEKNTGCALLEAASCSDSLKDKEGTVETDSSSSKVEKQGRSIGIAFLERLKGTEEIIAGSMPIPDVVSGSGVKRLEGGYDHIKVGIGLGNIVENNVGINVAESKEAIEVSRDAANSVKGISVAKSNEASGAFRDTGKANKGYSIKSMEDIADVAVLNKGPTSSNKCNEKNAGCALLEAASCSDSVKDKEGTVKTDSSSSKAEKQGRSIEIASPERLKGTDEIIASSTPITDVVSDRVVKRSEGNNEEATGSSTQFPVFCDEISGTKVWVTRIYRRPITLPLDNWYRSNSRSSRDDRQAFIEQFSRKY